MDKLIEIIQISIYEIVLTIGVIFLTGMVIEFLKTFTTNNLRKSFGRAGIYITSFFGVPIHETGHAIMCIIFGHKIQEIKLFSFKSDAYVKSSYNKKNLYHKIGSLFIALGPLFSGIIVLLILLKFLLPDTFNVFINYQLIEFKFDINYFIELYNMAKEIILSLITFENIKNIKFWIFIFIALSISTYMSLSKKDLENFFHGFITLVLIILAINTFIIIFSLKTDVIKYLNIVNMYVVASSLMALIFSFISFVFTSILNLIFGKK